jgi:hypothetical protein
VAVTTRTHFTFCVDTWTPDGESIMEHVAGIEDGGSKFAHLIDKGPSGNGSGKLREIAAYSRRPRRLALAQRYLYAMLLCR